MVLGCAPAGMPARQRRLLPAQPGRTPMADRAAAPHRGDRTTALITGANKGLGYETARRLVAVGHTVYIGSRDAGRGRRAAEQLGARVVRLDVTDDASVQAAAEAVAADGGLDVLVNNAAGIEPGFTKTDLNGNTGMQTVGQGAEIIVRMAQVRPDGPTGGYFDVAGLLPW